MLKGAWSTDSCIRVGPLQIIATDHLCDLGRHITDVHVDPWYTTGSDASKCYCETTAKCQVTGPHCNMTPGVPTAAAKWGNSEGNWCAVYCLSIFR